MEEANCHALQHHVNMVPGGVEGMSLSSLAPITQATVLLRLDALQTALEVKQKKKSAPQLDSARVLWRSNS